MKLFLLTLPSLFFIMPSLYFLHLWKYSVSSMANIDHFFRIYGVWPGATASMCDVTRSNFSQLLPEILDNISRASWIAFDCEYTALRPGEPDSRLIDTPAVRHRKHLVVRAARGGQTALVCQFGLAIFTQDADILSVSSPDKLRFTAHIYNFYICPRAAVAAPTFDEEFVCQASSLEFLDRHGFDFQRWLSDGLGYLSLQQEAQLRQEGERGTLFATVAHGLAHQDAESVQQICSKVLRFDI